MLPSAGSDARGRRAAPHLASSRTTRREAPARSKAHAIAPTFPRRVSAPRAAHAFLIASRSAGVVEHRQRGGQGEGEQGGEREWSHPASRCRDSLLLAPRILEPGRQNAAQGKPLSHEPERGPADLAPLLTLEHPLGSDDVACMHDARTLAGGTLALAGLRQHRFSGCHWTDFWRSVDGGLVHVASRVVGSTRHVHRGSGA